MPDTSEHRAATSWALHLAQLLLLGVGIVSHLALLFQVFHPKGFTVTAWVFPAVVVLP